MENTNRMNDGKKRALAVMLAALFIALILLAVTKISFITILKGPAHLSMASDFADKQYVSAEVSMNLGPFAEKYNISDESVTGRYILAGFGDGLVPVLLSERYFESEAVIREMTADWVSGRLEKPANYIHTVGTVRRLTEQEKELLDKWMDENSYWVASSGITGGAEDYSEKLSEFVICVDDINGMSAVLVYVLSLIALLFLAVAVVTGTMLGLGKFNGKSGDEPSGEEDIPADESEKAELIGQASSESEEETSIDGQEQTQESEPKAVIADEEETESAESELKAEEDNINNV